MNKELWNEAEHLAMSNWWHLLIIRTSSHGNFGNLYLWDKNLLFFTKTFNIHLFIINLISSTDWCCFHEVNYEDRRWCICLCGWCASFLSKNQCANGLLYELFNLDSRPHQNTNSKWYINIEVIIHLVWISLLLCSNYCFVVHHL